METKKIKTVSLEEAKEEVKAEGEAEQDVCSNVYNPKCGANKELLKLEDNNMKEAKENPNTDPFLYPNLNDPNFNIKIANKKEFSNAKYDGIIANVETRAEELGKVEYELLPQQAFVRNFMSFQTPYNSLLLFHGLGSGKTCSAIGVCEEMRDYLRQMGISKRIIIVASPNVQDNFKLQLFDERKLKEVDGIWTMKGCLGNKLLKEINPTGMRGLKKEKVIQLVKNIISSSYYFVGYTQFSNDIVRNQGTNNSKEMKRRNLENEYSDRLIVVDEVHNIRISDDNENKNVAKNLMYLVSVVSNLRLLLLSATPMFNSYKEIVWLLNLMNMNDRRGIIGISDIFDAKTGELTTEGTKLLIRKANGYVSYVRGENPYTFPFRVYPNKFSPDNSIKSKKEYPDFDLNGNEIYENKKIDKLQLFVTPIGKIQEMGYRYIMNNLREREERIRTTKTGQERIMPGFKELKSFGYTDLMLPLQALNIIYPHDDLASIASTLEPIRYGNKLVEKEDENRDDIAPSKADTGDLIEEINDVIMMGPSFTQEEDVLEAEEETVASLEGSNKEGETVASLEESNKVGETVASLEDSNKEGEGEHIIEGDTVSNVQTVKNQVASVLNQVKNGDLSKVGGVKGGFINPKELTGGEGLKSLMNYEDSKTPAIKGSFEYKQGKPHIFEPDKIGDYSSKIANVCKYIYGATSSKEKVVSDGIILIYSSYIDAGLIPMALALEEMGFTRHNAKPLFKTPRPIVDVKTMQPPQNKKRFNAAKYIMITGDPRLSPNNDADVKSVTNEDNIDGQMIKVVLISQAGSEGLDFKAIRQIHILDPWYNVNRLEQIIGRGVRNFSHRDLPFLKRNVQIFLYGTYLTNTEEEAVDLYVYRLSEIKAVKIGKVTRILKQISVDCVINHEQSKLTATELEKTNPDVRQLLSNHELLKHFEVGDIPNSATCDYGECEYKCIPDMSEIDPKVEDSPFNLNTYNETFMLINSDKIIQKIRSLFSDINDGRFFYKKKTLMFLIKQSKNYPTDQIYAALTQMINDNSEYIMDKYGRTGHLVNIGEYYLFQPSELNYPNISIFDRSRPLDYKHDRIKFERTTGILNIAIETGKEVLGDMYKNYMTAKTTINVDRGTDDWYQHCGVVARKMANEKIINKKTEREKLLVLDTFVVQHIVDTLKFQEKIDLMNYLEDGINASNGINLENDKIKEGFINAIKKYLQTKRIHSKKLIGMVIFDGPSKRYKENTEDKDNGNLNIYVLKEAENKWVPAEAEDKRDLERAIMEHYNLTTEAKNKMNNNVGFIGFETNQKDMVFKIKDTTNKRSTGYRCIQAGKGKKIIDILNEIEGMKTTEKTFVVKESKESVFELCIRIELTLRSYQHEKLEGKTWFIDTETAIYNEFEKREKIEK